MQLLRANYKMNEGKSDKQVAPPAGIEPATYCLEGSCSIQLSYGGNRFGENQLNVGGAQPLKRFKLHKCSYYERCLRTTFPTVLNPSTVPAYQKSRICPREQCKIRRLLVDEGSERKLECEPTRLVCSRRRRFT